MSALSFTNVHTSSAAQVFGSGGGASGTIDNPGSGDWSLSRTGTGMYVVTFAQPFRNIPSIVTSSQRNGTTVGTATVEGEPTVNGFTVQTANGSAAATDMIFTFIAMASN